MKYLLVDSPTGTKGMVNADSEHEARLLFALGNGIDDLNDIYVEA